VEEKCMYNLKIILPPNERFQSTKESAQIMQNANTGFCLLDLKRRHAGFATIDDAKKYYHPEILNILHWGSLCQILK
jgi:hypothetical protein